MALKSPMTRWKRRKKAAGKDEAPSSGGWKELFPLESPPDSEVGSDLGDAKCSSADGDESCDATDFLSFGSTVGTGDGSGGGHWPHRAAAPPSRRGPVDAPGWVHRAGDARRRTPGPGPGILRGPAASGVPPSEWRSDSAGGSVASRSLGSKTGSRVSFLDDRRERCSSGGTASRSTSSSWEAPEHRNVVRRHDSSPAWPSECMGDGSDASNPLSESSLSRHSSAPSGICDVPSRTPSSHHEWGNMTNASKRPDNDNDKERLGWPVEDRLNVADHSSESSSESYPFEVRSRGSRESEISNGSSNGSRVPSISKGRQNQSKVAQLVMNSDPRSSPEWDAQDFALVSFSESDLFAVPSWPQGESDTQSHEFHRDQKPGKGKERCAQPVKAQLGVQEYSLDLAAEVPNVSCAASRPSSTAYNGDDGSRTIRRSVNSEESSSKSAGKRLDIQRTTSESSSDLSGEQSKSSKGGGRGAASERASTAKKRLTESRSGRRTTKSKLTSKRPAKAQPDFQRSTSESTSEGDQFEVLSKCSSGSNSMPPPGFALPCKDVRDAIKYHHKLGKALSRLAMNSQIDHEKGGLSLAASTDSTASSTLDSSGLEGLEYVDRSCRLGTSGAGLRYDLANKGLAVRPAVNVSQKPWATPIGQSDVFHCKLRPAPSEDSACSSMGYSARSSRSKRLDHHLSFLENHMIKNLGYVDKTPPRNERNRGTSLYSSANNVVFFSITDDLVSPPPDSTCSVHRDVGSTTDNGVLTPLFTASPPSTPTATSGIDGCSDTTDSLGVVMSSPEKDWNDDDTAEQEDLDAVLNGEEAVVEDMQRIKDETVFMMLDMRDKMSEEMDQHRSLIQSAVAKMSEKLEATIREKMDKENKANISSPSARFLHKQATFSPARVTVQPAKIPAPSPVVDSQALLKEVEKSLRSMETNILDKISAQIKNDASHQLQAIEELIDEKVCKVIVGSNLEMKLAVQEMKKESERVSKLTLREIRTPPRLPRERSPLREKTLPRQSSVRKAGFICPGFCAPSPITDEVKYGKGCIITEVQDDSPVVVKGIGDAENQTLEETFAETMKVIDEFVDDCDDLADDFDKIVVRMQDSDIPSDPECEPDEFEYVGTIGLLND